MSHKNVMVFGYFVLQLFTRDFFILEKHGDKERIRAGLKS